MVNALMNSKCPARRWHAGTGQFGTNQLCRKDQVPMAITLVHGIPQATADDDSVPQFMVPAAIDVTALSDALNAQLNGVDITDEMDGFLAAVAGAFAAGMDHQRSLTGVS